MIEQELYLIADVAIEEGIGKVEEKLGLFNNVHK